MPFRGMDNTGKSQSRNNQIIVVYIGSKTNKKRKWQRYYVNGEIILLR